jgi:hypothetical protein
MRLSLVVCIMVNLQLQLCKVVCHTVTILGVPGACFSPGKNCVSEMAFPPLWRLLEKNVNVSPPPPGGATDNEKNYTPCVNDFRDRS